jgi:outer membrane protein assembly factor BamB
MAGGVLVVLWWLFFSRASWVDRLSAILLFGVSLFISSKLLHESVARANMGLMFWLFSVPVVSIVFVLWAVLTGSLSPKWRRITMAAAIILSSGFWILLRTNGMNGDGKQYFAWRWAATYEEQVLSQNGNGTSDAVLPDSVAAQDYWPGFRGPDRDGVARGIKIKGDFSKPFAGLWRKPVGPGCGSFAVKGDYFFTQEQRGENEAVTCYDIRTGNQVWIHSYKARFYEPHAGAGPRSTPAISGNTIVTMGATGIVNVLNAKDGKVSWTRNAAEDTGEKLPGWGYCGSPLVFNDMVIVAVSGRLAAYGLADGKPLWKGPEGGESYSSPQFFTVGGVKQVLLASDSGIVSVSPDSGTLLWKYPWKIEGRILQPALTADGTFLITGENKSIRLLSVTAEDGKWKIAQLWESPDVRAYFNDFVISKGFAFGFDGPTMTCTDLKDGKKLWKGNRYRGFQVLSADQDIIIMLTEKGEVAVVKADPAKFTELSRFHGVEGRTWNHPALADGILLVRNDREMAAFRLPVE